jgi:hypothetical protein
MVISNIVRLPSRKKPFFLLSAIFALTAMSWGGASLAQAQGIPACTVQDLAGKMGTNPNLYDVGLESSSKPNAGTPVYGYAIINIPPNQGKQCNIATTKVTFIFTYSATVNNQAKQNVSQITATYEEGGASHTFPTFSATDLPTVTWNSLTGSAPVTADSKIILLVGMKTDGGTKVIQIDDNPRLHSVSISGPGINPLDPPPTSPKPAPTPTPNPTPPVDPITGKPPTPPTPAVGAPCPEYGDGYHTIPGTKLCVPDGPIGNRGLAGTNSIFAVIALVIRVLLILAGALAVLFIIIGGFWYLTSAGNEEQAAKGRKAITYAIIGLVVIVLSYTIVAVVIKTVTSDPKDIISSSGGK